jgi:hypothetical protein
MQIKFLDLPREEDYGRPRRSQNRNEQVGKSHGVTQLALKLRQCQCLTPRCEKAHSATFQQCS